MVHLDNALDLQGVVRGLEMDRGYEALQGRDTAPGGGGDCQRERLRDTVLTQPLQQALRRLNPGLPNGVLQTAMENLLRVPAWEPVARNEAFHDMLTRGIVTQYADRGEQKTARVRAVDFHHPENNRWQAVSHFQVEEGGQRETLDLVLFVNGLPLVLLIFQPPGAVEDDGRLIPAFLRVQRLKKQVPSFFAYNVFIIITDGYRARVGTISAGYRRFMVWRAIDALSIPFSGLSCLIPIIMGLLDPEVFLDMTARFVLFEKNSLRDRRTGRVHMGVEKKMAAYHQYGAVNRAVETTLRAVSMSGDQRCGVVWHTQGSGKSMTMLFYVSKITAVAELENPTLVILTDRNDLDDQLFRLFAASVQLLRQAPIRAEDRKTLRRLLRQPAGGIIFTTIQKFYPGDEAVHPTLSRRRNIIVAADEAHRSQYGFIGGFARHLRDALPNASFIGFTGTPLERQDRSTRAVFGEYIDIYDTRKAVEDGITVPVYYEGRLVEVALDRGGSPGLAGELRAVMDGGPKKEGTAPRPRDEPDPRWARLETILASTGRLRTLAADLVEHFEKRLEVLAGKAMVVAVSRRVCVMLYREIIRLRPHWHGEKDDEGQVKAVITGTSSDPLAWQAHIRDNARRRVVGDRLKDPGDPLHMVLVCDMWLTGFDVPCLHTLYIDKPLKDHLLMQTIARVNRVFGDKPGGLVVDYLGIAPQLEEALAVYLENGGGGRPHLPVEEAVNMCLQLFDDIDKVVRPFKYRGFFKNDAESKTFIMRDFLDFVLAEDGRTEFFMRKVPLLVRAFSLAAPHPGVHLIKDNVAFFQAANRAVKRLRYSDSAPLPGSGAVMGPEAHEGLETAVRQVISRAVTTGPVVDIFDAAGFKSSHISIFSDQFLALVQKTAHPHVTLEVLARLLNKEIAGRGRRNFIQGRTFMQLLRGVMQRYRRRQAGTRKTVEALVGLIHRLRKTDARAGELGLTPDELALYESLTAEPGASKGLTRETLKSISRVLARKIKKHTPIDWAIKESVRSRIKVLVKRTLRLYSYPVNARPAAVEIILQQAELLAGNAAEMNGNGGSFL